MAVLVVWLVVAVLLAPVFAGIINSTTDGDLLFATTCGAFFGLAWPVTAPVAIVALWCRWVLKRFPLLKG